MPAIIAQRVERRASDVARLMRNLRVLKSYDTMAAVYSNCVVARRCLSAYGSVSRSNPCIGIRRETINAWERRAPLAPQHVKKLTKDGVRVLIQPSNRRAYPIQDYIAAGAIMQEDLVQAQLIMSVKQVPMEQLLPNKTYAFFSHTIKAQPDNMEMLDTILHRNIRLIDYEKMTTSDGQRLVMFGRWAGYAGFINILHGLGLRLLALGHHTPFLHIALAHNYSDSHMAINAVRDCGYEIALNRLPRSLGPLIFVFTGSGNVSRGAQNLFKHLPHEFIDPATLPHVAKRGRGVYDKNEFEAHPEKYVSKFASEIAPYATVIINGVYWGVNTPRLITIPDAKYLLTSTVNQSLEVPGCPSLPHRLMAICDISADPGGSIEFMTECTTIDKPFTIYDADFNMCKDSFDVPSGCLVCSIDNMPAQMPIEATEHFGNLVYPYVRDMLNLSMDSSFDTVPCREEVKRAVITWDGELTPAFKYIAELRKEKGFRSHHKAEVMAGEDVRRVLLLGAGMVSDPLAQYYAGQPHVRLTVACDSSRDGQRLAALGNNIDSIVVDVQKEPIVLDQLIGDHDLCVSLLPYIYHVGVAKMCIKNRKNMITTSYITPELQALDADVKEADITIMNEAGFDPGIDHMLAMECIDRVHECGGKIKSFVSFAGGLPAPEVSDNALRYKFSWSPKGVLLALMNPARYLMHGRVIDIAGGGVIDDLYDIDFMPGFSLVGYANRDSTTYAEIYGVQNEIETLMRGTLRYKGFVEAINALKQIGYLSMEPKDFLNPMQGPDLTWKQVTAGLLNQQLDIFPDSLRRIVGERLGGATQHTAELCALEELGLFSEATSVERQNTPLDTLVPHLTRALAYTPGERDIVILNHDIDAQLPSGLLERHRISLVAYGDASKGGHSAMARTVGYTCAIISQMILDGEIQRRGMLRPISREVYRPVLKRLQDFGIRANTKLIQLGEQ